MGSRTSENCRPQKNAGNRWGQFAPKHVHLSTICGAEQAIVTPHATGDNRQSGHCRRPAARPPRRSCSEAAVPRGHAICHGGPCGVAIVVAEDYVNSGSRKIVAGAVRRPRSNFQSLSPAQGIFLMCATFSRFGIWRLFSVGVLLACCSSVSMAQSPPTGEALNEKGYLEEVHGDTFTAKLGTDDWVINLSPDATVTVTGTAEPEYLHGGVFVKFSGDLDKKGTTVQKEVEQIEVFTPTGKGGVGVFDGSGAEAKAVTKPAEGTVYELRGRVTTFKPGELTLMVGTKKMTAKTSLTLVVNVNSTDLSLAQSGDAVRVTGWYSPQQKPNATNMTPGYAEAGTVMVTLAKPLAAASVKKAKPSSKAARLPKQPKDGATEEPAVRNPFTDK